MIPVLKCLLHPSQNHCWEDGNYLPKFKKRLRKILKFTSGFLYYVSITGITGTKKPSVLEVKKAVSRIKANTNLPVVVGFGIDNYKQAAALNKISDGCVIGSAIIKIIEIKKNK